MIRAMTIGKLATAAAAAVYISPVPAQAEQRTIRNSVVASYYAQQHHGRRTASGERFDMNAMTAAHRTLPFGTRLRVTNARTGRSIVVRVNDRGPFTRGRGIDLSLAAARQLGMVQTGVARVTYERL